MFRKIFNFESSIVTLDLIAIALALGAGGCFRPAEKIGLEKETPAQACYYVSAEQFEIEAFDPPPASASAGQKADLAAVLDRQGKRTEADCLRADGVFIFDYRVFLGDDDPFAAASAGDMEHLFRRLDSDAGAALELVKGRFRRPRPEDASPEVRPCIRRSRSWSYPSGHSSYFRLFAAVLGDILPARRDEFVRKADGMGLDRVMGGVHYPTDVEAGNRFGDRFHALLLKSPDYLRDVEKMKSLVRAR